MKFSSTCLFLVFQWLMFSASSAVASQCQPAAEQAGKACKKLQEEAKSIPSLDGVQGSGTELSNQCEANADKLKPLVDSCKKSLKQCQTVCQQEMQDTQDQQKAMTAMQIFRQYCSQQSGQIPQKLLKPGEKTLANMNMCSGAGRQTAQDAGQGGGKKDQGGQQQQASDGKKGAGGGIPPFQPPKKEAGQPKPKKKKCEKPTRANNFCNNQGQEQITADRKNVYQAPADIAALGDDGYDVNEWDVNMGADGAMAAVAGYMDYNNYGGGSSFNNYAGGRRNPASVRAAAAIAADKLEAAGGGWQQVENGEAGSYVDGTGKEGIKSKKPGRFGAKVFVNGEWKDPDQVSRTLNDNQMEFLRNQNLLSNLEARLNSQISRGDICEMYQTVKELKGSEDPNESDLGFSLEGKVFRKLKQEGFTADETGLSMRCNMFM